MRPDPSTYLRALRNHVATGAFAATDAPLHDFLVARTVESLDRLILRHGTLPALADRYADRRAALMAALSDELARRGLPRPPMAEDDAPETLARMELDWKHQAAALARLAETASKNPDDGTVLRGLIDESIALDHDFWRDYATALNAARAQSRPAEDKAALPILDDSGMTALLRERLPQHPAVAARNVRAVSTVSSHEAYFFEVEGNPDWPAKIAMRRDRAFALTFTSLADEMTILDFASRAGLPAPRPLLFIPQAPGSSRGAMLMERMPGAMRTIAEMGSAAPAIYRELAGLLARLHVIAPAAAGLPLADGFDPAANAIDQIAGFEAMCRGPGEPVPVTLAAAFAWLRLNACNLSPGHAIIHGDIDYRNILIEDGRISGMLDWELAKESHPAQDIGYCMSQVEEVMPLHDFLAAYQAAGGPALAMVDIRYYQLLGYVQRASYCVRAYRAYRDGQMDDFVVSTVGFVDLEHYYDIIIGLLRSAEALPA